MCITVSQSLRIFGAHAATKLRLGLYASSLSSAVDYGRIVDTASSSTRRGYYDYANNGTIMNGANIFISEPLSWVYRAQTRQWNEKRTSWTMLGSYSSHLLSGGGGSVSTIKSTFHPSITATGFAAQTTVRSMSSSSSSSGNNNDVVERIEMFRNGKPTLAYAKTLPRTFAMMTNEQVLHFSEQGSEYDTHKSLYYHFPSLILSISRNTSTLTIIFTHPLNGLVLFLLRSP